MTCACIIERGGKKKRNIPPTMPLTPPTANPAPIPISKLSLTQGFCPNVPKSFHFNVRIPSPTVALLGSRPVAVTLGSSLARSSPKASQSLETWDLGKACFGVGGGGSVGVVVVVVVLGDMEVESGGEVSGEDIFGWYVVVAPVEVGGVEGFCAIVVSASCIESAD